MREAAGSRTVAIIAHDPVTVLGLRALLRAEPNLGVSATINREDGVVTEWVARQHPLVAVLDVSGPGSHRRLQTCRDIRERAPRTQVVVVANAQEPGIVERAQTMGALGVIARCSEARDFLAAVDAAMQGHPYVCPLLRRRASAAVALSARQEAILRRLADGLDTQQIAEQLGLSPETIKSHVKAALAKLNASGRTHGVALALRRGLID